MVGQDFTGQQVRASAWHRNPTFGLRGVPQSSNGAALTLVLVPISFSLGAQPVSGYPRASRPKALLSVADGFLDDDSESENRPLSGESRFCHTGSILRPMHFRASSLAFC